MKTPKHRLKSAIGLTPIEKKILALLIGANLAIGILLLTQIF